MNAKTRRRTLGMLSCAFTLGGASLAVAPSAASAASRCASKSIAVKRAGGPTSHYPVKAVSAQGLSCAQAYKVITLTIDGKLPKAWKSVQPHFTAPDGLVPQELKASGGRVLEYAVQGG